MLGGPVCMVHGQPHEDTPMTTQAAERPDTRGTEQTSINLRTLRDQLYQAFDARLAAALETRSIARLPRQGEILVSPDLESAILAGGNVDARRYRGAAYEALLSLDADDILANLQAMPEVLGEDKVPTSVTVHEAKRPDYVWQVVVTHTPPAAESTLAGTPKHEPNQPAPTHPLQAGARRAP